jgi:hypothetical protein
MDVTNINFLTLPSLSVKQRNSLPECSAIYFVMNGEDILYIGATINLLQRWNSHHRWEQFSKIQGIKIVWLQCNETDLIFEIEKALITYFQPSFNRTPVCSSSKKVNILLTQKEYGVIKQWASEENRSTSSLVATILREAIKSYEQGQYLHSQSFPTSNK